MQIKNVVSELPKHSSKTWARRSKNPDCIVIHHSVTPGDYPIERIAEYHISRDYPGIAYHYVVTSSGDVYQTNDDMDFTWHGNDGNTGLGVCLLGDFTHELPPPPQLEATRNLVTILKARWDITRVIGHREAGRAQTACPGDTWNEWKSQLEVSVATDFSRYPRPENDTGAGVHLGANASFPLGENQGPQVALYRGLPNRPVFQKWLEICYGLVERGLLWGKVISNDDSALACLPTMLYAGMMPVIRMYWPRPWIVTYSDKQKQFLRDAAELGCCYLEDDNERNLVEEWPEGRWPGEAMPFDDLVTAWYERAQFATSLGYYFAIPALAPGGNYDDIRFLRCWLRALDKVPGAVELLRRWGWISVHPAALTHPLDYPYDPINQAEHPGATLRDDSNCWLKWQRVHEVVLEVLGLDLPVLATEGGAWPGKYDNDARYPALSVEEASKRQYEMLKYMEKAPSYFLANMPWIYCNRLWGNSSEQGKGFERMAWIRIPGLTDARGNYIVPPDEPATLPVVDMLKANPAQRRSTAETPTPQPPDQAALQTQIGNAIQAHIVPLYPEAAFEKSAKPKGLLPASPEVDMAINGIDYRAQAYRSPADRQWQHIVYCVVGEWDKLTWFKRAN